MIGGALRPAGGNVPGIAQEAVLQLLRTGLLQAAQHTLFRRDADAVFLAQILRRQGFQEDQPPGAVGDGVEKLHCHPVVIHQHPEGAAPHLAEGHMGQGAAFLRLDVRRLGNFLQIVPEHPPPQPHGHGREPPHRHVQSRPQHGHVDGLRQGGGQAEEVVPVPPLSGGIDLGGVVQPHPPQAPGRGQGPVQEVVDGLKILLHILVQAVQHIGVPPLRGDVQPAAAPGGQELFVQGPGVVQHHLVPAHKQQRRRQARQVAEQRRAQGVRGVLGIAPRVKPQQLRGHGGIVFPVLPIGIPGAGQVRPGGNADQAAGQLHAQLLQLQAQAVDQPASGGLPGQHDLPRLIALLQQVLIALQRVVQGRRIRMLRGQAIGRAEHPHAALRGQGGGKALGVFQTAAGIAAAVEIQDHPGAALVLGHDPRPLKMLKIVVPHQHLPPVQGGHQLAQLVLALPGGLQRQARHKGLEKRQLRANQLCVQLHAMSFLS